MYTIYYVLCPDNQFSSSSKWILMSCQPYRVISGQSNSGHKQIHISKLFSHIYQPSASSVIIKILQWVSGQCTNNNKKGLQHYTSAHYIHLHITRSCVQSKRAITQAIPDTDLTPATGLRVN